MKQSKFMNEPLKSVKRLSLGIALMNENGLPVGEREPFRPKDPDKQRSLEEYARMKSSISGLKSQTSNALMNNSQASILMQNS